MLCTPVLRIVVVVGAVTAAAGDPETRLQRATWWGGGDRPRAAGYALPVEREGGFRALAAGVYLAGMGDWATTARFRQEGIEEANPAIGPFADNPAAMAAVKLGGGTLVNYVSWRMREHGSRLWAVPQIVWIALNLAAAIHNADAAD